MRIRVSKRELLHRIEALERRLTQPTPRPLEGQQAIPIDDDQDDNGLPATPPAAEPRTLC